MSVVSHGHERMVIKLVNVLLQFETVAEIIITLNRKGEQLHCDDSRVQVVSNDKVLGYGENHNKAFRLTNSPYFCVLNPDVELLYDPFPQLLGSFSNPSVGVVAPRVLSKDGLPDDSARKFPNIISIFLKIFRHDMTDVYKDCFSVDVKVEWCAGMFLCFDSSTYAQLNGFDESFFLYYEDVDICARALSINKCVMLNPSTNVVHAAQRESRRSIKFFVIHLRSCCRYLLKYGLGFLVPRK